jgi:hypothetical protein
MLLLLLLLLLLASLCPHVVQAVPAEFKAWLDQKAEGILTFAVKE